MIIIIVAYDKNRVIGKDGKIPWHISEDLKRFQRVTMGHNVVMGRRTWDSIPLEYKPLPGRTNIVLSRGEPLIKYNEYWAGSLTDAIGVAKSGPVESQFKDIFIIGGESIYKQALQQGLVDKVIASEVKGDYEGDTYFPELEGEWDRRTKESHDEFDVVEYRKVKISCKECGKEWCCMECACEDDALNYEHFRTIYEMEEVPDKRFIICCHCSGEDPSWMNRED